MKDLIRNWLINKWSDNQPIKEDYQHTFGTASGQRVLAHFMDAVYCDVYLGNDPIAMARHEGAREFVHTILETLDAVEHPRKARFNPEVEERQPLFRSQ